MKNTWEGLWQVIYKPTGETAWLTSDETRAREFVAGMQDEWSLTLDFEVRKVTVKFTHYGTVVDGSA